MLKSNFLPAIVTTTNSNLTDPNCTVMTITAGGTTSTVLNCGGTTPTGLFFPTNWTPCDITFMVGRTPAGMVPVGNFDASALTLSIPANGLYLPMLPSMFNGINLLQIVCSGATQASTVQIDVALSPIFQGVHG